MLKGVDYMKKIIPWMLAAAVIMLVFPWLAVTFIKGDGGMAVCFILFFAVNPIYAICSGAYAGKDIKIFWSLPIITALFFLLGIALDLLTDVADMHRNGIVRTDSLHMPDRLIDLADG